jgi:Ca2+-binding EF-hand superfamily protein
MIVGLAILVLAILAVFCIVKKKGQNQPNQKSGGGKMPNTTELLKEMDSNEDGKLSESEVKGPLKDFFSKIDSDNDGFLTVEELENAPKPQGNDSQGRPPRSDK